MHGCWAVAWGNLKDRHSIQSPKKITVARCANLSQPSWYPVRNENAGKVEPDEFSPAGQVDSFGFRARVGYRCTSTPLFTVTLRQEMRLQSRLQRSPGNPTRNYRLVGTRRSSARETLRIHIDNIGKSAEPASIENPCHRMLHRASRKIIDGLTARMTSIILVPSRWRWSPTSLSGKLGSESLPRIRLSRTFTFFLTWHRR